MNYDVKEFPVAGANEQQRNQNLSNDINQQIARIVSIARMPDDANAGKEVWVVTLKL